MSVERSERHGAITCSSSNAVRNLDDLVPSERIAEVERQLTAHAATVQWLEAVRADALRQLRRERLSLSQMGELIGATRQQVHRLLHSPCDGLPTGELLYVAGGADRPVEVGAELEHERARYRVVRVQRMQPLADGASAPWAVIGTPVDSSENREGRLRSGAL